MNLFTKQKENHRHRKQTYGYQRGRGVRGEINQEIGINSHVRFFVTPWTIQSMEFFRPERWSGQPFNSPGQNTGVSSLSLLQWIFPTQELNWGLLHCRWILYQLSYWARLEGEWIHSLRNNRYMYIFAVYLKPLQHC